MSKASRRIGAPLVERPGIVGEIPTENADAALRFCQALARQVEAGLAADTAYHNRDVDDPRTGFTGGSVARRGLSGVSPR